MKRIDLLYQKALFLHSNYIANEGDLDYADKEYGWLCDELEDVEVGFFKDDGADSSYAEKLREKNYELTEEEAINILEHRIESIEDYFDKPLIYPDFSHEPT